MSPHRRNSFGISWSAVNSSLNAMVNYLLAKTLVTISILLVLLTRTDCKILGDENDPSRLFPEWNMAAPEIISFMGYPAETHMVTSLDGYIIEMHRIPNKTSKRPPILLQHGLVSSSNDYIINYPNQSLAYVLSDVGYDVWMGNYRGNIYSNRHIRYSSDSEEYWNFTSLDLIFDLANSIDYILNETNHQQLYYVGLSFGSTGIFSVLSRLPEYNSKVKYIFSLAPVVNSRYMRGLFPVFCQHVSQFGLPPSWQHQIPPNLHQLRQELGRVCAGKKAATCAAVLGAVVGAFNDHFNMTRLPLYVRQLLGGTSHAIIKVACQVISRKDVMRDYDYGRAENMFRYGQNEPPGYDLSKVTSPVFIYYSYGDFFSCPGDIKYISDSLANCQGTHAVQQLKYNHLDFLWASNNKYLLYDDILTRLEKHEAKWKT